VFEMSEIMVVSAKGQITLPAKIRAKLGIKIGDRILGEETTDGFIIKKSLDFLSLRETFSGGKIPNNEEELLSPSMGRHIMERK
jgi:AbrB family looped-hinge helix DNA binding protein